MTTSGQLPCLFSSRGEIGARSHGRLRLTLAPRCSTSLGARAGALANPWSGIEGARQHRRGHVGLEMADDVAHQPVACRLVHHVAHERAGRAPVVVVLTQGAGLAHHVGVGMPQPGVVGAPRYTSSRGRAASCPGSGRSRAPDSNAACSIPVWKGLVALRNPRRRCRVESGTSGDMRSLCCAAAGLTGHLLSAS